MKSLIYRYVRPLKWFLNFVLTILFFASLQYLKIEIYFREKNVPFSGDFFYNPYHNFNLQTLKANFHAHSQKGTYGKINQQSPERVYDHYTRKGYDIISLSDYQRISRDTSNPEYIPVYEHGYNLKKSHQLILNSKRTSFFDFSLFGNYDTRQQVINILKLREGLLVLAHPGLWGGYREKDMKYLKGYDFIEVFNNYAVSTRIWDAALTCGYPAWILAGDDCHDITRPNLSFNNWTRISSKNGTRDEVLKAMKMGCHYGIRNLSHEELNFLDSCMVINNEIYVYFRNKADRISIITDNGKTSKVIFGQSSASYNISDKDHYVRIEAVTGKETICLNPIIRYNGYQLSYNTGFPLVNSSLTILARFIFLLLSCGIIYTLLTINGVRIVIFRPRKTMPVPSLSGNLSLG